MFPCSILLCVPCVPWAILPRSPPVGSNRFPSRTELLVSIDPRRPNIRAPHHRPTMQPMLAILGRRHADTAHKSPRKHHSASIPDLRCDGIEFVLGRFEKLLRPLYPHIGDVLHR